VYSNSGIKILFRDGRPTQITRSGHEANADPRSDDHGCWATQAEGRSGEEDDASVFRV
jgi:hypothetical protein